MTYQVVTDSGKVLASGLTLDQAEQELCRACNDDVDAYIVDDDTPKTPVIESAFIDFVACPECQQPHDVNDYPNNEVVCECGCAIKWDVPA